MGYLPERLLDPPEDWQCNECGKSFYPSANQDPPPDDSPVLCYDCKNFED